MLLQRPRVFLATKTLLAGAASTTSSCGCLRKQPPFPSSRRRPLPFTLPDLAPHEEAYATRSQVDLMDSFCPEEMEHIAWDRVEIPRRELEKQEKERQEEHFLRLGLYFVEKDFHFGSNCFFVGFRPELSEGLLKEIDREVRQSSIKKERMLEEPADRWAREDVKKDSPSPDSINGVFHSHGAFAHQRVLSGRKQQQQHQEVRQLHSSGATMAMSEGSGRAKTTTGEFVLLFRRQGRRPFALVLQSPFRTMQVHMEFLKLKEWDPSLDKVAFMEATKKAVSTVTHLLRKSRYTDLKGLLSSLELNRLRREVETKWSEVGKNNIALDVDHLIVACPVSVRRHTIAFQRFCDIQMVFVGVKESPDSDGAVSLKIEARFHRDFTEGRLPDWVITRFRVVAVGPY